MGQAHALWSPRVVPGGLGADFPFLSGPELSSFRDALRLHGSQLMRLHTGEMARLIGRALDSVRDATCRIAVIGQARSGKTTLINSLIQKPDFLPCRSDVPTGAVTRVHVGLHDRPARGAVFEFFSEEDWRRIAAQPEHFSVGGERPATPLNADLAQMWQEQLRLRVENRLGADFARLFGQRHEYEDVTSELLARYVSADVAGAESRGGQAIGQFANITRRADVYCSGNPLDYPVTLIDTPGMLDPYLFRNQPTVREVETADAIVVVVCPQQLTSGWHPTLLQVLRRLPKDRIIFFLNRIDTVASEQIVPLIAHMRAALEGELQSSVDILAGCLTSQGGDLEMSRGLGLPALRNGLTLGRGSIPAKSLENRAAPGITSADGHCSGLSEITTQIWRRAARGPHVRALLDSAATLQAVARTHEVNIRARAQVITSFIDATHEDHKERETQLRQIERYIAQITQLCEGIGRGCDQVTGSVQAAQSQCEALIERSVSELVEKFIDVQVLELQDSLAAKSVASWTCDTAEVAQAIDNEIAEIYRRLRLRLFTELNTGVENVREAVVSTMPELAHNMSNVQHSSNFPIPTFEFLSGPIAFHLDRTWWRRWLQRSSATDGMVSEFKRLLRLEFDTAMRATLESLKRSLAMDGATILHRLSVRSITVIDMLVDRREHLCRTAQTLLAAQEHQQADAALKAYQVERQALEKALSSAAQINQAFGDLVARGAKMFATNPAGREHAIV